MAPDDGKAPVTFARLSGVFPLQSNWAQALSQVSHALAQHTKEGLRITYEKHFIQSAIDYLEIALKNEDRNNEQHS